MILIFVSRPSKRSLAFMFSIQILNTLTLVNATYYMHLSLLLLTVLLKPCEEIIMQYYPASCHFLPLNFKCSHCSLCKHPYQNSCEIWSFQAVPIHVTPHHIPADRNVHFIVFLPCHEGPSFTPIQYKCNVSIKIN